MTPQMDSPQNNPHAGAGNEEPPSVLPLANDGATEDKPPRDWIRKAASRRLQANHQEPQAAPACAPAADYAPGYTAARGMDWTPDFDTRGRQPRPASTGPDVERNWITSAALVLGGILAVSTAALLQHGGRRADAEEKSGASEPEAALPQPAQAVPEVRRTMARFFAATTPREKAALVRGGMRLLPAMIAYYRVHPDEPAEFHLASNVEFTSGPGGEFVTVSGTTGDGRGFDTPVELTPDGPRLDWRYFTGAGDMEWQDWIVARPAHPVRQRGIGILDDYYAGLYADPEKWICLRVTDMTLNTTVWAYADRNGPFREPLLRLSGMTVPVRLQGTFEFSAGSGATAAERSIPQVLLCGLEDYGWLDQSPELLSAGSARLTPAGAVENRPD